MNTPRHLMTNKEKKQARAKLLGYSKNHFLKKKKTTRTISDAVIENKKLWR
jgi:hypothetical protein